MNVSRIVLATLFTLILGFALAGCSDDEPDQPREVEATHVPADAEPEALEALTPGDEFVLKEAVPLTTGLADAYEEECIDEDPDDFGCAVFRSLVVVELVMALEQLQRSRDQRGADGALEALDITNEPDVLIAALRVLGQFPDTPGIAEKALPLMLESPWLMVQQLAANVLRGNPDPTLASLGSLWDSHHSTLVAESEFSEYPDFAPAYFDMEFPEYPDAEWFSPADSDRSVGWSVTDDITTVTGWLREELEVDPLGQQQWWERVNAASTAVFEEAMSEEKQAELRRVFEEWTRTQDPALLEKMEQLQLEMSAPMEAAGRISDMGVASLALPDIAGTYEEARYFIAEEKNGHIARAVIVYPLAGKGRTVIQTAWNLVDYPSAWPSAENGEE
jgi:hypothetical protein